jgi:putative ABC transport system permease protein
VRRTVLNDGGPRHGCSSVSNAAGFLDFLYVLLAFPVVVSLFAMVNTLVLSVFERTRELGMLRTLGMTRRASRLNVQGNASAR